MSKIVAVEVGDKNPKSLELGDRVRLENGVEATVVRISGTVIYVIPDDHQMSGGRLTAIAKDISRFIPVDQDP